ncbi:hypothetical protein [Bradyrhizobium sp. STM 3809]|nr:hypothetical protein [Bradyrhizobium sp. STM 3809]CCE02590.1 hypothetical protein BRAS3809_6310009 [Bradyrhizobium sp. STM 3809]
MSTIADELTAAHTAGPSLLRRLGTFIKAIVSRIDLSHFPRSCCS